MALVSRPMNAHTRDTHAAFMPEVWTREFGQEAGKPSCAESIRAGRPVPGLGGQSEHCLVFSDMRNETESLSRRTSSLSPDPVCRLFEEVRPSPKRLAVCRQASGKKKNGWVANGHPPVCLLVPERGIEPPTFSLRMT